MTTSNDTRALAGMSYLATRPAAPTADEIAAFRSAAAEAPPADVAAAHWILAAPAMVVEQQHLHA